MTELSLPSAEESRHLLLWPGLAALLVHRLLLRQPGSKRHASAFRRTLISDLILLPCTLMGGPRICAAKDQALFGVMAAFLYFGGLARHGAERSRRAGHTDCRP